MFEQSILAAHKTNKQWTLAASLVLQVALVAAGIIMPLLSRDTIPGLTKWVTGLVAPPPQPAPQTPTVATQTTVRLTPIRDPIFVAPLRRADHVDMGGDLILAATETLQPGVIGALSPPSASTNVLAELIKQPIILPRPPLPPAINPVTHNSGPVHVSGGVQEARLIYKVIPVYPQLAIVAHVQGTVHLVGVIGKDGTIRELRVVDGNPLLTRAAMEAVLQWKYKPTMLTGEPVEVIAPIEVVFTLNR